MRADRLLTVLLLLQQYGRLTARVLAERLEVSERTIQRDMEALSASGVPVYAERGNGGGWVLAEGYRTDLTGLTIEEARSLLFVNPTGAPAGMGWQGSLQAALAKVAASLPEAQRRDARIARERLHVDGAGWRRSAETFPLLPVLQEAIWTERRLRIRYRREDETVRRVVEPLGLVAKSGTWYVVVSIAGEGELRTHRVSRLETAELLEERFARPEPFDLAAYWERSMAEFQSRLPTYPVRLRIAAGTLPRLRQSRYAKLTGAPVPADEPGWYEAEADLQTPEYACELLLAWGGGAVVLEPGELRGLLLARAREVAALYEATSQ